MVRKRIKIVLNHRFLSELLITPLKAVAGEGEVVGKIIRPVDLEL